MYGLTFRRVLKSSFEHPLFATCLRGFSLASMLSIAACGGAVPYDASQAIAPQVTWVTPSPITYGTPLTASQLDASASVPGVFNYSPASGAILTAGSHQLRATFTPTDTRHYSVAIATVNLTVTPATPKINWPQPAPVSFGTPLSSSQLQASANTSGQFTYSPPASTVLEAGSHTLTTTFTPTDTLDYTSTTASMVLDVKMATPVITWSPPAAISYGTSLTAAQLNATASAPGTFVYSPLAGTVLESGTHSLNVVFTPTDSKNYTAATGTAILLVNPATPVVAWNAPAAITYGNPLTNVQLNATANVAGTFSYSPAAGTLLTAGTHSLNVTFTPTDTKNYSATSKSVTLNVNQATPSIDWNPPAAITYGALLSNVQLNAKASVAGTFAYSPAVGTLLAAGTHLLKVTFTPADAQNCSTMTKSVPLTVSRATPLVAWNPPASITYGTSLSNAQLNATANVPGAFAYSPSPKTVLTAGAHSLNVTFTPTDAANYGTATASVMLTVNQAAPIVSWTAPARITYGTPLGNAQLNATANVPGTFAYSPAAGTVLSAGSRSLNVTFSPDDAQDYVTTSAQQSLQVSKATPILQWGSPAPIAINMPLTSSQLSVQVTNSVSGLAVPGTTVFTPALGSHFDSAGDYAVAATFTPKDPTNYAQASSTRTISVLPFGVVAWGDSLTEGGSTPPNVGSYASELAKLIYLPVVNEGVGGETSTQIAVRQGAIATTATVAGSVIPASASVNVTFPQGFEPVTIQRQPGVSGYIAGVHGTVTYSPGVWLFARSESGDPVTVQGATPFLVDKPYAAYLPIFWEGRNDYTANPPLFSDMAAQVASIPDGQDFYIFAILNPDLVGERKGESGYNRTLSLNNQLANLYGTHFIDVRKALIEAYDPTSPVDVWDYQADVIPTSLRAVKATGTLAGPISANDTTFDINLAHGVVIASEILTIGAGDLRENVFIKSISGSTVTVTRDAGGIVGPHAAGVVVTATDNMHLNSLGNAVVAKAVAPYLSRYLLAAAKQHRKVK